MSAVSCSFLPLHLSLSVIDPSHYQQGGSTRWTLTAQGHKDHGCRVRAKFGFLKNLLSPEVTWIFIFMVVLCYKGIATLTSSSYNDPALLGNCWISGRGGTWRCDNFYLHWIMIHLHHHLGITVDFMILTNGQCSDFGGPLISHQLGNREKQIQCHWR